MSRFRTPITMLALFVVAGCGGGGGSNAAGGGPFNGTFNGTITNEDRRAAIEAVADKASTTPVTDRDAYAQTMLAFLKNRREFVYADISDDLSIWGWFPDGQPICIVNNELPFEPRSIPSALIQNHPTRGQPVEVPKNKRAVLTHMFATIEGGFAFNISDDMEKVLKPAGYDVEKPINTSVGSLRSMGSVDVLFTNTHGGLGYKAADFKDGEPIEGRGFWPGFCMWTGQTYIPQVDWLDSTLQEDLKYHPPSAAGGGRNPRVVLMIVAGVFGAKAVHYAITSEFVKQYMTFGDDSVWFTNACWSGHPGNKGFRDACFAKGLGGYFAWDNSVKRGHGNDSARFFMDRMAGANLFFKPTPLTRPLTGDQAMTAATKQAGSDARQTRLDQTVEPAASPPIVAQLIFFKNPKQLTYGLLTPSILRMSVDEENDLLTIDGTFGSKPGKVTMNGTDLELAGSWSYSRLQCKIPRTGANASGDVVVEVDGHKSNRAQLTMWEGTISFVDLERGSQKKTADLKVMFRADVRHLLTPEAQPSATTQVRLQPNLASTCKVGASGSDQGVTYSLNGSPDLPLNLGAFQDSPDFVYSGRLVPADRMIYLDFEVRGVRKALVTPGDLTQDISFFSSEFGLDSGTHRLLVPLIIGANYGIESGSRQDKTGNLNQTMTWGAMAAKHPPDDTAGRASR